MISLADYAACLAIDRGSCQVSARSLKITCQYSSTMLFSHAFLQHRIIQLATSARGTRTHTHTQKGFQHGLPEEHTKNKPRPSSCGVLRSCSSVLSNGAHEWWKTDVGICATINQHLLNSVPVFFWSNSQIIELLKASQAALTLKLPGRSSGSLH